MSEKDKVTKKICIITFCGSCPYVGLTQFGDIHHCCRTGKKFRNEAIPKWCPLEDYR